MRAVSDYCKKGTFVFYKLTKKAKENALISLDVLDTGEADIYIGKQGEYPTLSNFELRSASFKNDQIELLASENSDSEKEEEWIIGVYGRDNSKYSLTSLINPMFRYVEAKAGKVYSAKLKKNEAVVLSYFNRKGETFDLVFNGYGTPVKLYGRRYKEEEDKDFL